jgi:hypothetical protein
VGSRHTLRGQRSVASCEAMMRYDPPSSVKTLCGYSERIGRPWRLGRLPVSNAGVAVVVSSVGAVA